MGLMEGVRPPGSDPRLSLGRPMSLLPPTHSLSCAGRHDQATGYGLCNRSSGRRDASRNVGQGLFDLIDEDQAKISWL